MQNLNRRQFLNRSLLAAGAALALPRTGFSAIIPGIETTVPPLITGEERNAQPDIWALEVNFKPVRMILVDLPDAQTGKTSRELVWYLAYRAVVRPTSGLADSTGKTEDRPIFVPELTFVVDGRRGPKIYEDRVLPVAQAAINKRERHDYKNSVEIVGPLPKMTPERSRKLNSLDGVAMWTGVDPDVVNFTIYMAGFSNGYRVSEGPGGEEIVSRRTLTQKFWRPGDRFEQHEEEIRIKDDPVWIYR
jgi:hypothetical protein